MQLCKALDILFAGNVLSVTSLNFTVDNVYVAKAMLNSREIDLRGSPFVDHTGQDCTLPPPSSPLKMTALILPFRAVSRRKPHVLADWHSIWLIVCVLVTSTVVLNV